MKGVIYIPATRTTKYEIYLMNVPFNSSYKHLVYFPNTTAQNQAFGLGSTASGHFWKYHYTNLNIIVKNNSFVLSGRWDKFNECNYMAYRYTDDYDSDLDHTSKWYFAFIDDVNYNTRLGTTINHTLDVWQTYHIDAKYNRAFIERGHIAKDQDGVGDWIAPEPIGFGGDEENEINIFHSGDYLHFFKPLMCIESLSLPEKHDVELHRTAIMVDGTVRRIDSIQQVHMVKYNYGGVGSGANVSGVYRILPTTSGDYLNNLLSMWQTTEYTSEMAALEPLEPSEVQDLSMQTSNHIGDIIGFSFIPQGILKGTTPITTNDISWYVGNNFTTVGRYLTVSQLNSFTDSATINRYTSLGSQKLGNGYVPKNKKMFTSLARSFKIFNYNGLSIPIRPELISGIKSSSATLNVKLWMHTFGNEIKIEITNYKDLYNNYISVPYCFQFTYGINNNVGVTQATNIDAYNTANYLAKVGYISKGIGIATQVAGAVATGGLSQAMPVSSEMLSARAGFMAQQSGIQATGVIGSALDLGADIVQTEFDLSVERSNAYTSQTFKLGNSSGDRIQVDEDFIKLRLAECNPTVEECELIDKFLDMYGYQIDRWYNLGSFLTHRSKWNYVKTKDCSIQIDGPNKDTVAFNNIFNAGTTLWRSYIDSDTNRWVVPTVGNYNQDNN